MPTPCIAALNFEGFHGVETDSGDPSDVLPEGGVEVDDTRVVRIACCEAVGAGEQADAPEFGVAFAEIKAVCAVDGRV